MGAALLLLFFMVFQRFYVLQVVEGEEYQQQFADQIQREQVYSGSRAGLCKSLRSDRIDAEYRPDAALRQLWPVIVGKPFYGSGHGAECRAAAGNPGVSQ